MPAHRQFSERQKKEFRSHLERLRRDFVHHWSRNDEALADDDVALEIAEREIREIQDIEDALEKLTHQTYGVCEGCGTEISVAHLEAVPETRYCGPCLVEKEIARVQSGHSRTH